MTDAEMCRVGTCRQPGWLLCEHPERPPDDWAHIHLVGCQACRIGAEAAARQWPKRWKIIYDLQTLYWADDG